MVKVQQGVQNRYFKYDSLGRLIRVRQPEQETHPALALADPHNPTWEWSAAFAYDVLGNVVRATDANGVSIVNEYDRAGRVTKRCYTKPNASMTATTCAQIPAGDRSTDTPEVSFHYDGKGLTQQQSPNYAKGKLTKVANGVSATDYMTFDNLGRLTRSRQITDGVVYGDDTNPMTYMYNLSGALVEERYPSGRKVKNEFDSDGELSRIYGSANATSSDRTYANSFSYNATGNLERLRLGNGRWEHGMFNNRHQLMQLALGASSADSSLWKVNYEYGEVQTNGTVDASKNTGTIAKQTINFSGLAAPFVQIYKYDSLSRVTEARETVNSQQTWKQTFGYDRYGNRTAFTQDLNGQQLQINNLTLPTVDPLTNRFQTSPNQGYTYDKNGNLINDPAEGGRQFVFNGENKQIEVKDSVGTSVGKYFYDGEGKRVKKQTAAETTIFVYSGAKLVAEYSTQTPPANPTTSYVATDTLQSVRVISDAFGQIVSRRDFLPFGEELYADGQHRTTTNGKYSLSGQDAVRQRFTGYQKDMETGFDFAEARYYNNQHGRFTAVDPLLASGKNANPQTFNRYAYVINSPLNLTDKTGMQIDDGEIFISTWINKAGKMIEDIRDLVNATLRERGQWLLNGSTNLSNLDQENFQRSQNTLRAMGGDSDAAFARYEARLIGNKGPTVDSVIQGTSDTMARAQTVNEIGLTVQGFTSLLPAGGARAAVITNRGFGFSPSSVPNTSFSPSRFGQDVLDDVSARLAANPGLARSALSEAEYLAGQNSVGVARMQYGNAIERMFWREVNSSGAPGFVRLGGPSRADGTVNGQLFDITTTNPVTIQRHFARPYGEGLQLFTYERPRYFTTFPAQ